MDILSTPEFERWLRERGAWERAQILDRLDRVRQHGHFGDRKHLGDGLFELRWKNGRRVYFSLVVAPDGQAALLLLGGDKNGQKRDIPRARRILEREAA